MNAATLLLIAPCSLLLGAALQILAARLCSARIKGVLAFLFALPAMLAVVATAFSVQGGQAVDLNVMPWDGPLALVLPSENLHSALAGGLGRLDLSCAICAEARVATAKSDAAIKANFFMTWFLLGA